MLNYRKQTTASLRSIHKEIALVLAEREHDEIQALHPTKGTPITAQAAAAKYRCSVETIRRKARSGKFTTLKEGARGHSALYDEHDIALYFYQLAREGHPVLRPGLRTDLIPTQ